MDMAREDRTADPGLIDRLVREPGVFEFFQATRLLHLLRLGQASSPHAQAVVGEGLPSGEAVRFRSHPSLAFPPSEIVRVGPKRAGSARDLEDDRPVEMEVAFLGLIGPLGVLPQHYTSLVMERIGNSPPDMALRDFLDIFHHRALSLFYRAWEKYRFPVLYERYRRTAADRLAADEPDPLSTALLALVGQATAGLRDRLSIHDDTLVYYSGHLAHYPRSAAALEQLLADFFEAPVTVVQFQGRWITLPPEERSRMSSLGPVLGRNCRLPGVPKGGELAGQSGEAILGSRVWNVSTKFRIRMGPLSYKRFREFLPTSAGFRRLCDLARFYAGPALSFELQLLLRREEVPCARLRGDRNVAFRLGWDSWSHVQPYSEDADQAVFRSLDEA